MKAAIDVLVTDFSHLKKIFGYFHGCVVSLSLPDAQARLLSGLAFVRFYHGLRVIWSNYYLPPYNVYLQQKTSPPSY